jgi:hypothetical protein
MNRDTTGRYHRNTVVRLVAVALGFFVPLSAADPGGSPDATAKPDARPSAQEGNAHAGTASEQTDFEHLLEQRDFGTFRIYKRLPDERRVEVFRAYSQGASMEEIKANVLSVFLNRK